MADECEVASEQQVELEGRRLLARLRERERPAVSAAECGDCGAPIPAERQWAAPGCTRCVDCASINEAHLRRYA